MTDSIQKFGETYLNLSHIRQITFEERAGGESLICIVNWSDGTGDRFRGETAKALLNYLDPDVNNDPEFSGKIDQNSLVKMLGVSAPTFRRWRSALGIQVKKYYSESEELAFYELKNRLEDKDSFEEAVYTVIQECL